MRRMEVRSNEDFEYSFCISLLHDEIYRIVFDFGLSCYRIEDRRFRVVYAEDMPQGYYDQIIREFSNIVSESEQDAFLQSFSENQLKCMPSDKQNVFIFDRKEKTAGRIHIIVTVSSTAKDMVAEFRLISTSENDCSIFDMATRGKSS